MIKRVLFSDVAIRAYSMSRFSLAEAAAAAPSTSMTINFCRPDLPIYTKKVVDKVLLPGESGEYGITVGHSPIISQLKPGVVTVIHVSVSYLRAILFFLY